VISKSSMILLPLMFMLFFLAEEFIVTVYSEKYLDSVLPFRVYLALLLIRTMDTDAVFIATGKNNLVFLRSAVSLAINLFLSVTLVKLIGYVGAALSTVVIAFFWSAPFTILSIRRIAKVRLSVAYPYHQVGRIIAISAIGCVVFFLRPYLHFLPPATLLIVLGGFYGLVTLILMDRFGFLKIGDLISNARSFAQQRVGSQPKHGEV